MQEEDGLAETQLETPSIASPPATITLSGSVSEFSSSGYDSVEVAEKGKMQWKQFFLGLFLPYAVGIVVLLLFALVDDIFDPYSYEERVIEVNEDGYFVQELQQSSSTNLDYCFNNGPYSTNFSLSCTYGNNAGPGDQWIVRESVRDNEGNFGPRVEIGAYFSSNSTIWFQLNNSSIDEVHIALEFHDPQRDKSFANDALETSVCFLPFIYIGAVIFAFVKQKKSLGIGLLSALGSYLALIALLVGGLILLWL